MLSIFKNRPDNSAAVTRMSDPARSNRRATDVRIRVDGGYEPSTVSVALGDPVRITFNREDASPCSEHVVFTDFGIDAFLPLHEDVTVEMRPEHAGEYEFTCAMGMLRGQLIVTP